MAINVYYAMTTVVYNKLKTFSNRQITNTFLNIFTVIPVVTAEINKHN